MEESNTRSTSPSGAGELTGAACTRSGSARPRRRPWRSSTRRRASSAPSPRADEHAAAGPGDAERRPVRRGVSPSRRDRNPRERAGRRQAARLRSPCVSWPARSRPRSGPRSRRSSATFGITTTRTTKAAGRSWPSASRRRPPHPGPGAGRVDHGRQPVLESRRGPEQVTRKDHSTCCSAGGDATMDRRALLTRAGRGSGRSRCFRCSATRGCFAEGTNGLPRCRTSARRRGAPSTLHMAGAPRRSTPGTTSRSYGRCSTRTCRIRPRHQRLTTMTSGQTRFPVAPSHLQVRAARQVRRLGQRAACPTPRRSWTTSPSSGRSTPRRSTTSRPITFIQTGNQSPGRPASARGSPTGWAA